MTECVCATGEAYPRPRSAMTAGVLCTTGYRCAPPATKGENCRDKMLAQKGSCQQHKGLYPTPPVATVNTMVTLILQICRLA